MSLMVLTEDELRQTITIGEAIEAVKTAFAAMAENRINTPGSFRLDLPEVKGKADVKGAYVSEAPYYFVRVGNYFIDNPIINLPVQSGLIVAFDAASGFPVAIMLDNGYLSQIRAGAAGALAADYLANKDLKRVAVIGSGSQAYIQLKSLMAVRHVSSVVVWGRSPLGTDSYARRLVEDHDLDMEIAPSVEAAVREADLIITATASQEPLVRAKWLKPGVHITAIGSNTPSKQELHDDVLRRADIIIVDNFEQCAASGEIQHGLKAGAITPEDVRGELGGLVIGKLPGRTRADQITLADLTGLDIQDTAVGTCAVEKALFLGLGQRIVTSL